MKVYEDIEQGTVEWLRVRMGMPTASCFKTIIAEKGRGGRETYMRKLAGEIVTGNPMSKFFNEDTERGKMDEPAIFKRYALGFETGECRRVGFITNFGAGCSPDALVGSDGMAEFKSAEPHIQIERLDHAGFPMEHLAQCQGALWIAEREWIDCVSESPGLAPYERRAYRDEKLIARIAAAVEIFNAELAAMVERVRAYGLPQSEAAA